MLQHFKDNIITAERLCNNTGGPKVGIQLLNYFLYVLKLLAVHFMLLVKYLTKLRLNQSNFDELFFQQDGAPPHYASREEIIILRKSFHSIGSEEEVALNGHHACLI